MILKSCLRDYTDAYILFKGTITIQGTSAAAKNANSTNKRMIFKNCPSITDCISEINKTQVDNADNAKDIDWVMSIYNSVKI